MLKRFLFIIGALLAILAVPRYTLASELGFTPPANALHAGESFTVNLWLNHSGEPVNAMEGTVVFDPRQIELKDVRDGNSIINFWVDKPVVEPTASRLKFAGIIPGGYEGKGLLLTLVFEARKEGPAALRLENMRLLRDDGKGTEVKVQTTGESLVILPSTMAGTAPVSIPEDTEPPEPFTPEVAQNPDLFDGQYFLVFATQDKSSGIDHYEVREGNDAYAVAESPYLLKSQRLDEGIYVKAVDKADHERVEFAAARNPKAWYAEVWWMLLLILVGLAIAMRKRKKYHHSLAVIVGILLWGSLAVGQAYAASLYFWPSSGNHNAGSSFQTTIFVKSEDQAMNAVSGVLTFPTDKLEVTSLSKSGSVISFWAQDPSFSNATGTINFEGVALNPGYTGKAGKILTVSLRAKKPGDAALQWATGSVLANDGLGTPITGALGSARFALATPPPPPAEGPAKAVAPAPEPTPASPSPQLTPEPAKEPLTPEVVPCPVTPPVIVQAPFSWTTPILVVGALLLAMNFVFLFLLGYLWSEIRRLKNPS